LLASFPTFGKLILNCLHSKYYPAILTLVALAFALSMFAQSGVPVNDSVNVVFSNFMNTSNEKSIVLLTNRNIYAAGEKIWFKAYVVNSVDGTLDVATKICSQI